MLPSWLVLRMNNFTIEEIFCMVQLLLTLLCVTLWVSGPAVIGLLAVALTLPNVYILSVRFCLFLFFSVS